MTETEREFVIRVLKRFAAMDRENTVHMDTIVCHRGNASDMTVITNQDWRDATTALGYLLAGSDSTEGQMRPATEQRWRDIKPGETVKAGTKFRRVDNHEWYGEVVYTFTNNYPKDGTFRGRDTQGIDQTLTIRYNEFFLESNEKGVDNVSSV